MVLQRCKRVPLAALLCLCLLWCGLTVRAQAAETTGGPPEKASREITYLGRGGQAPVHQEDAPAEDPARGETGEDSWRLLLINGDCPLPKNFSQPELADVGGGQLVDVRIADALRRMLGDARQAGLHPIICSAYRTEAKQTQLHQRKVRYYLSQGYSKSRAEEAAAFWVARPGTSEHQAGLAVDIVSREYQILDAGQENTAVQQWLMAHCAEYGFILRYPTDKSAVTNVGYEPWHYRYVGEAAAREMADSGLCLEEYLAAA